MVTSLPDPDWGALPPEDCSASAKKMAWFRARLDAFAADRGRPLSILDFGCGNAAQAGAFIINARDIYMGVDIHQPSLDHARANFGGPTARFVDAIPSNERFDVILASEVLEHLDDPDSVLAGLVRDHLAPEGRVLGSVPNGWGLTELEKKLDEALGLYGKLRAVLRAWRRFRKRGDPARAAAIPYNHENGHVQFFTQGQLRRVAASAGLKIAAMQNGSIMGADLSGVTLLRPGFMIRANVRAADFVPHWASATWFFEMQSAESP